MISFCTLPGLKPLVNPSKSLSFTTAPISVLLSILLRSCRLMASIKSSSAAPLPFMANKINQNVLKICKLAPASLTHTAALNI